MKIEHAKWIAGGISLAFLIGITPGYGQEPSEVDADRVIVREKLEVKGAGEEVVDDFSSSVVLHLHMDDYAPNTTVVDSSGEGNSGTPPVSTPSNPHGEADQAARPSPDADRTAVRRCLGGDVEAFGVLVERYQDRIFNACVRIVSDRETAREMAQEAFLRAYERLCTFREGARFSTWLFAIAINQCRSELRRRKTRKHRPPLSLDAGRSDEDGWGFEPPSREIDPTEELSRRETRQRLERELERLPETYRIPVVLRDVEELSYEEIAEVIETPIGTVRSRIHRGRLILRERLSDLMGREGA